MWRMLFGKWFGADGSLNLRPNIATAVAVGDATMPRADPGYKVPHRKVPRLKVYAIYE